MCRHLGYVGPAVPVGTVLTRGSHSLRTQAWAPRDMRGGGTINADGFGVAWWREGPAADAAAPGSGGNALDSAAAAGRSPVFGATDGASRAPGGPVAAPGPAGAVAPGEPPADRRPRPEPVVARYRNAAPIWTDPAVDEVLSQLDSTAVLAAVRSATVGTPIERTACAPFTDGRSAFSHNGVIPEWRLALSAVLADLDIAATTAGATRRFQTIDLLDAEAPTDSAALWILLRGLLGALAPGESPATALRDLTAAVLRHSPKSRLTLLLGDGERLWATTVHHGISALVTAESAVLASEPYDDDPGWQPIADHMLVTAAPGDLTVQPLLEPKEGAPR
ncbi:class II glutamine amidotransferase [Nocardia harenae]|uniref:class II glutamine amidotransferase n=1 Tax=Nocardia harenae TaxID=358707 RepID=UPI0008378893|nr:class II glutamine amidotransferase [Nocardia harenae]